MAILVRVPPQILEDLVGAAITKQGNIYKGELAKLIGASKESLDGKTSFYLISLMKLCGFAEADMAKVLKKSRIVNQRGAVTRDRKSTRLNSSHRTISYAVFCLKKKINY